MDLGWMEMVFAAGTADGIQTLVEIALLLIAAMMFFFVLYLILGKI